MMNLLNILKLNKKNNCICEKSIDEKMSELYTSLQVDALCIKLGEDLIPFVDELVDRLWVLREKLKDEFGYIVPPVRFLNEMSLQENEYSMYVRDNMVLDEFAIPRQEVAVDEIIENFENICMDYIDLIFSTEVTENYIECVKLKNQILASFVTFYVPITGLKLILVGLIKSGKSIKDINFVFEKISEEILKDKSISSFRNPKNILANILDVIS